MSSTEVGKMSSSDQVEYHRAQLIKDGLARRKRSAAAQKKRMESGS